MSPAVNYIANRNVTIIQEANKMCPTHGTRIIKKTNRSLCDVHLIQILTQDMNMAQ